MGRETEAITLTALEEGVLIVIRSRLVYGAEMCQVLGKAGRSLSQGTVYQCLDRLEEKGMVTCKWGEEEYKQGARRKYFLLTERGATALEEAERFRDALRKL